MLGQKKNDQVARPMDPVEGMGQLQQPGGSQGRPTAFHSGRRTWQEVYTGPDGCIRGCTLTIVACLRIDESKGDEDHEIPRDPVSLIILKYFSINYYYY